MFWKKEKEEKATKTTHTIEGYSLTDTGCVRDHNEDAVTYQVVKKNNIVYSILADGMGGHNGGEIASNMMIKLLDSQYRNKTVTSEKEIKQSIQEGNKEVYRQSRNNLEWKGMGTTCVVLSIQNGCASWGHVGDSRLYVLENNVMTQLTTDHTVVEEMKAEGLKAPEHQSHVLTQAIGTKDNVNPETGQKVLHNDSSYRFLMCSDGLYDMLSDYEIKSLLEITDGYIAASALIAMAKEKGGLDNVSVSIIDIKPLQKTEAEASTKEMKLPA